MQTEIRLVLSSEGGSKSNKGKTKGGKKKKGNKSSPAESSSDGLPLLQFDHTYLDDHHRAMLVAYLLGDLSVVRAGSAPRCSARCSAGAGKIPYIPVPANEPAHSTSVTPPGLPYNDEISAVWWEGVNLSDGADCISSGSLRQPSTLIIGLGGGALAMAIQKYLPSMHVDVVELVPGLEALAREHFSFVKGPRCRVLEGDGLEVVRSMERLNKRISGTTVSSSAQSVVFAYDHIIVDVDGKDLSSSEGLSAPPREFVTNDFISSLRAVLAPNGVLSFNVVSRNPDIVNRLGFQLAIVFGSNTTAATGDDANAATDVNEDSSACAVYKICPSTENVNVTLHVTNYLPPSTTALSPVKSSGPKGSKKISKKVGKTEGSTGSTVDAVSRKQRMKSLEEWLQVRMRLFRMRAILYLLLFEARAFCITSMYLLVTYSFECNVLYFSG